MFDPVRRHTGRQLGKNLEQIALDEVRLGHAARHVAPVELRIRNFEPFAEVPET